MATNKSRSSAPKAKTPAAPAAQEEEAVKAASSTEANQAEQPSVMDEKATTEGGSKTVTSEDQSSGDAKDEDGETQPSSKDAGKGQIEVKTRRGLSSFRRAGLRFGPEARTLQLEDLTLEQAEALRNERNLVVEEVGK